MIVDPQGKVRIPDVWTNENWREGIDNIFVLLHRTPAVEVPRQFYGAVDIQDPKIVYAKEVRTSGLISSVEAFDWLWTRAKKEPSIRDYHDPLVCVFDKRSQIPHYPGADEKGTMLFVEGFWGFSMGFGIEFKGEDITQKRFSETVMAISQYSFRGLPPFLDYCSTNGNAHLEELSRLNPQNKEVQKLFKYLRSEAAA